MTIAPMVSFSISGVETSSSVGINEKDDETRG
jgi:hypothetical protein